jgi:hypothetical protein
MGKVTVKISFEIQRESLLPDVGSHAIFWRIVKSGCRVLTKNVTF